ncbi:class I SAM-dependent DNA methyltransferase [Thalassiella azotivora]
MQGFDPRTAFGPHVAARYDDVARGDEEAAADFLASRSAGSALELAIGTGRIALPLARRGVRVDGIELSPHMVERLRGKPGGDRLDVRLGDMARETTGRRYPLVYLVYNTIFNLLTQDDQVECFRNAARHLDDGGVFVVEAAPPWAWVRGTRYVDVEQVSAGSVVLDVNTYDPVTQVLDENHVRIGVDGILMGPVSCRLAAPSELDLMARLAGLRLVERWGGWCCEPFTASSALHVSVYAVGDAAGASPA